MPRIRSIKPEFFEDEDLAEHPFWIRLLFQGLWVNSDKEGRILDRPLKLKAKIFPYDKLDIDSGLDILSKPKRYSPRHLPFIVRYSINGERYIQILSWSLHQAPHHTEKESVYPAVPNAIMEQIYKDNGETTVNERFLKGARQDEHEQGTIYNEPITNKEGEWGGITEDDKAGWNIAFPACDIAIELKRMSEWIKANPAKGKRKNYRRFIYGWLSRNQERGGTRGKTESSEEYIARQERALGRKP